MRRSPLSRALVWITLLAGVVVFAAPLVWMLLTTMKLDHELVRRPVRWLPDLPAIPAQGPWTDSDGRLHQLALGRVYAVTASGEEIPLRPASQAGRSGISGWMDDETGTALEPLGGETDSPMRVWEYDLSRSDAVSASGWFSLPAGVGSVDHWVLEVGNDLSFHRIAVTVNTPTTCEYSAWHVLGNDESQDLILSRAGTRRTEASALTLRAFRRCDLPRDPGLLSITVELAKSSPLRAASLKFTEQYRRALEYLDFWSYTRNSVFLVVMNVIGAVLSCSLVAYSFARLQWFGRDALFVVVLATMMLPPQVTMVPQFLIWRSLGAYDTLTPLWLPAFLSVPFFVFLLRQFMLTIPKDLEDAARIDGCSSLGIWARVTLPLIKPALVAVAIFQFLWTWNDFLGPLIYVANPGLQPLSVGLYIFKQAFAGQWGMILAASTMMLVPVLAMFFCAQRHFIEGVTLTGLKA
ncbi:MAG: carbohydrate ABC transporter permease [Candidatus Sumerlaeia bacterium]|nr:carbohydrate ABC transporter permease [Candidatus Sumerlaeia bacterium]